MHSHTQIAKRLMKGFFVVAVLFVFFLLSTQTSKLSLVLRQKSKNPIPGHGSVTIQWAPKDLKRPQHYQKFKARLILHCWL